MIRPLAALPALLGRLRRDIGGLAAVEYALTAPIVVTMFVSGAELTNFTVTKLRVSQIALHVADNGARIGTDSLLTNPQISESQINDLLVGANLQGGNLNMATRGRIIVSSVEPVANPNTTGKYKVHWQRCYGAKVYPSSYGVQGATNLAAFGQAGRQITVPDGTAVIYVEVAYDYQPLISARLVPTTVIHDVAAMVVRDQRDLNGNSGTGVYNAENVTASTCA
jgi:Flp pilus assembly protein TadG